MSVEILNNELKNKFEARPSNWLPVPSCEKTQSLQNIEDDDFFPKADVVEFFYQQGAGMVERQGGIRYPFDLDVVEVVGSKPVSQLSVGMKVGYDIARTSDGYRVTKLKIY